MEPSGSNEDYSPPSAEAGPVAPQLPPDSGRYHQLRPGLRYLLAGLGWVSIVLGVIGVFLPIMPTTPFILLGAWCFARSSERFHTWLLEHRYLGPIVRDWQSGAGIPRKVRNRVLFLLWFSLLSTSVIVHKLWLLPILLVVGIGTSVYLLKQPVT